MVIWGLSAIGCNITGSSSTSGLHFPDKFPLTTGNAWVYESTFYTNGILDDSQTFLDTLYIHGMYQDAYLYSWDNDDGYSAIIKQENDMVFKIGAKYFDEVIIYETPVFWSLNTETGSFNHEYFENEGFLCNFDSLYIESRENIEIADRKYNAFVQYEYGDSGLLKTKRYFTIDGYSKWEYFNTSGDIIKILKQIKVLKDFYPQNNDNL